MRFRLVAALVNARAAGPLVKASGTLFAERYPIERMRVASSAELNAPPTGDGNTTAVFACRPVRGPKAWSQHAYGLVPEPLSQGQGRAARAGHRLPRPRRRPARHDPAGRARRPGVRRGGLEVGGDYRSLKDFMHFSANGG